MLSVVLVAPSIEKVIELETEQAWYASPPWLLVATWLVIVQPEKVEADVQDGREDTLCNDCDQDASYR